MYDEITENTEQIEETDSYIVSKIGRIRIFNERTISQIKKESVELAGVVIEPDSMTTLNDFFDGEVKYLGTYKGWLQFQAGEDTNLFDSEIYTSEFKKVTDHRILNIYQIGTARDYHFKNGIWK